MEGGNMSYNVPVYTKQGGKTFVIGSSGDIELSGNMDIESSALLEVKSGGEIEVESGGEMEFLSGAVIDIQGGVKMQYPVERLTTATTGSAMARNGMTVLKSTKTAKTFTMATPVIGEHKWIACVNASTTGKITVKSGSSGRTFDGTNWILDFKKGSDAVPTIVHLVAETTARWIEVYRSVADGTSISSTST
jgi:hypothetical protein